MLHQMLPICWWWEQGVSEWPAAVLCPLMPSLMFLPASSHAARCEGPHLGRWRPRLLYGSGGVSTGLQPLPALWPRAPELPSPRCWPQEPALLGTSWPARPACWPAAGLHGRQAAAWSRWHPLGQGRPSGLPTAPTGPRRQRHDAVPPARGPRQGAELCRCSTPRPWRSTAMPHSLGTASRQGGLAHRGCLLLLLLGLLRHLGWLRAGGLTLFHHVLVLQVVGSDHWGHDDPPPPPPPELPVPPPRPLSCRLLTICSSWLKRAMSDVPLALSSPLLGPVAGMTGSETREWRCAE